MIIAVTKPHCNESFLKSRNVKSWSGVIRCTSTKVNLSGVHLALGNRGLSKEVENELVLLIQFGPVQQSGL